MGVVVTIILGILVGWAAAAITRANTDYTKAPSWVENAVVGIIGAFVGSFISNGGDSNGWINFGAADIFWAFVGAVILCVILNLVTRKRVR